MTPIPFMQYRSLNGQAALVVHHQGKEGEISQAAYPAAWLQEGEMASRQAVTQPAPVEGKEKAYSEAVRPPCLVEEMVAYLAASVLLVLVVLRSCSVGEKAC